jgi:hypothetical protein
MLIPSMVLVAMDLAARAPGRIFLETAVAPFLGPAAATTSDPTGSAQAFVPWLSLALAMIIAAYGFWPGTVTGWLT